MGLESTALRQINKHEINSTIVIKRINLTCKLYEDYKHIHAFLFVSTDCICSYMPVHVYVKYNEKVREIYAGSHYRQNSEKRY